MQPCSTCKQYGWECTFHDTAKKRGPPKGYIESLEARLRSMERLLETIQAEDRHTHKKRKGSQSDQSEQSEQSVEPSESASPTPPNEPNQSSQKPIAENHPPSHSEQGQNKVVGYMGSSSGYYLIGDIMTKAESKSADGFKVSASKGEGEPPGGAFIH
ncbi:hypothetical protein CLU79DRAFT_752881 [Phycomyces nitens]|nr:hypothetical protein CLU79DRAFT_752881 [Phycomyces nitens]